ncbi:uncharacterized protein YaiI (UPF0178 family) [Sporolactobacillus spathodeae]|uniref:UPF0178 protein JOC27_000772 n=2 Tax=Sporolactobacillus spathodeae TaxID=1465502 RepID=A0ABS2Q6B2_9BACL|nr:uncharacterized protein YaiI (UPF0178 family) [Sporolactobacillus spathodeae]
MMKKNTIYVDADACPVKEEIMEIAGRSEFRLVFVASYASYSADREADWVFVDQKKEEADLYIVNHAIPGDFVITQDMGLAGLLTGRGVFVLTNRGSIIYERDISEILHRRYLSYKSLAAGKKLKGPKPFTDEERKKFSAALTKLLCHLDH